MPDAITPPSISLSVEPPKPPASTSADLLADIFSSQPAVPSTAGNTDLFASTANPTPATNGAPSAGDNAGQDLFQVQTDNSYL